MENRKIKNATCKEYNGIEFKSLSEVMVYKTLLAEGFNPEYESHTYTLWDGFVPTVPYYVPNKFKRKDYRIVPIDVKTLYVVNDRRPPTSITYTPDFYFEYNGKKIIVEVKGFANDVWPYKFKMFRGYVETLEDKDTYEIWEIHTKKQLIACINHLKQSQTT